MKNMMSIIVLMMLPIAAMGFDCPNSGKIQITDTETKTIKVKNCRVIQSSQGGHGECAFIAHKVACDEWKGLTVVSQKLNDQAAMCHVFTKNDGFDGNAEACLDQALGSSMTAWTGGPTTRNIAAESNGGGGQ